MSFLEYFNKKVLKDFGVKDFDIEDKDVEVLEKYRGNYKTFKYVTDVGFIFLIGLFITRVLMDASILNFSSNVEHIINNAYTFMFIFVLNSLIAMIYNQVRYEIKVAYVKGSGLSGSHMNISPHSCINYGKGKFIMLNNDLVDALHDGELDINEPLNDPEKVVALNLKKSKEEEFKCNIMVDIQTKSVRVEATAPEDMYEEFHNMCLNGKK